VPDQVKTFPEPYLRLRAEGLATSLRQALREAAASEFPGEGPRAAIGILCKVLDAIDTDLAVSTDKRTLVMYCKCLESLSRMLGYFDNAVTEQTPRGLAHILESLVRPLQPTAQFVLWPSAEYNYAIETLQDQVSPIVDGISTEESVAVYEGILKSQILLVSFPRVERDNVLQHAILGHELGHPIADSFIDIEEKSPEGSKRYERLIAEAKKLDGLVIATATAVHPGFCGTITLELVNVGEVPLVLYPGLCVAQMVLFEAKEATDYDGRFGLSVGPIGDRVSMDRKRDLRFWTQTPETINN